MNEDIHFYEPSKGHGLPHDPFNAIVGPRPIGWMSSQDSEGRLNLAPYSFFNAFNYTPPIIGFASIGAKDSLHNIRQTGEFCWNLATRPLAEQMNQTCAAVPADVSEFELAGWTPGLRAASMRRACPRALSLLNATDAAAAIGRAWTAYRWRPGWCWARWWAYTSLATCSRTAFTTPSPRNPYCAPAGLPITLKSHATITSRCTGRAEPQQRPHTNLTNRITDDRHHNDCSCHHA